MKKNFIKGISIALSMVVATVSCTQEIKTAKGFVGGLFSGNTYQIRVDDQGEREGYIVTTKSQKAYEGIKKNLQNEKLESEMYKQESIFENEKILVMNLTKEEAEQIDQMKNVETVEKDVQVTANEVVPVNKEEVDQVVKEKREFQLDQWNLKAIDCVEKEIDCGTQDKEETSREKVKVAVLDSGVSYNEGIDVCQRVNLVNESNINPCFEDATGHGTGIAGMIVGNKEKGGLDGVSNDIALYSVQVLDQNNVAPVSRIVEGIYWCINNGIDVINLSLGCKYDTEILSTAVRDAINAGIILVAAAGNAGEDNGQLEYPAAYNEVVAVGSSDEHNHVSTFTSGKNQIDVMAPGEKIWTYSMLGGYMAVDGTSIATAQVTGAVARVLQVKKDADAAYIRKLLRVSTTREDESQKVGVLSVKNMLQITETNSNINVDIDARNIKKDVHYDVDNIVSGCWGKGTHENIVKEVCSGNYIHLISQGAYIADDDYSEYKMLHAQHNYVRNLHFLYMTARKIKESNATINTKNKIVTFISNISTTNIKDGEIGKTDIDKLKIVVADCLYNYALTKNNSEKAAYIIGLASHELGDTFAHRTMIPKDDTSIQSGLFSNDLWLTFNWKKIHFLIETRDLKKFLLPTSEYEDNTRFYSQRYGASRGSIGAMLYLYNNSRSFSPRDIFTNYTAFDLKLNNLRAYAESNGYSNEGLEGISTNVYRVNRNHEDYSKAVFDNENDYYLYDYYIC